MVFSKLSHKPKISLFLSRSRSLPYTDKIISEILFINILPEKVEFFLISAIYLIFLGMIHSFIGINLII